MTSSAPGKGEALIWRLRRLTALAQSSGLDGDRAKILALLDDIQAVQRGLMLECKRLDEEMRQSAARVHAASAYARSARPIRQQPLRGEQ